MRIAFLGPAGTYNADALSQAAPSGSYEPQAAATVHDAIVAVARGEADRALVPFENSIERTVRPTFDTLAHHAETVAVGGELDYALRRSLSASREMPAATVASVRSPSQ